MKNAIHVGHSTGGGEVVKNAQLKVYKGAPHGMCTTLKDKVNEEPLAFFKS